MSIRRFFEFLTHRRFLVQTAFVVIVTAVYIWLIQDNNDWVNNFENVMLEARMTWPPRDPPQDVVILAINRGDFQNAGYDAATLQRAPELAYMNNSWPWDRRIWALLTERLVNAGVKLVGYDLVFNDPNNQPLPGDKECGEVFAKDADKVVIASHWGTITPGSNMIFVMPGDLLVPRTGPDITGLIIADRESTNRYQSNYKQAPKILMRQVQQTPGRALRDLPEYSFAWLAAKKVLGVSPLRNAEQLMLLNYYGPSGTIETRDLVDVLKEWDTTYDHGAYFKNKVVFVGPYDVLHFNQDFYPTPLDYSMPGVEIQATAYSNLVRNEWLEWAPDWIVLVLAIGTGALALMVSLWVRSVLLKLGLFATLGVVFLAATQDIFWTHLIVTPVAGAAFILICCGAFGTLYDYILSQYERQRMLGMFESMVSPGVAGLILSHRGDFEQRLGGQRKEVVVLFSDIRGFTSWSEQVGPDALVAQLNEYLTAMVGAIQEEGGTLQKYIGDALMAAWGDVRDQTPADGAEHAVRAALRMQGELARLNATWQGQPSRQQLTCGIGINHGGGVVGQIGHPRRQEFTVMGDAVNLAARIESATKQYRQPILVGESVHDLTKDIFLYRLVDKMRAVGKTQAACIYAPLGEIGATPPPGLPVYETALEKYFARDFAGAAELFRMANQQMGGADFLCQNFSERCDYYLRVPPPPDWDGIWTLKEK
ncbi:MAG TPA: adenylate/guanylate cyclase domain-containing protein [Opitutales bacterium]|nr:adenylate/guanylate cyclase domain-containing protein [Opitutales bacterium]